MRLNSIKLSGFKSFVEPTQFQLPGQLVGVVGPNGCGKSNIIDAVRWVLGESKASELRGESMQDVIFNGSSLRKPAGRASVELAFDNADGRAGGPWNRFAEIAVKRVLTRDGTSSYYINNQPVRRRDVQDVFLGTGLGPRAYAIIGQGTISRIIESKPEELRLFLEEAAGVSKYKERRRETENRLKDTRENLTRVEDILRELNRQPDKLESQAEVAGRYRALQQDSTLKQHQLWFLKHRDAAREEERVKAGGRRRGRGARIADRRAASRRGRARSDPPVALRSQRRAARGAGRARRGRARRQPARGADPLRRRRPRADRPAARRSRGAARAPGWPRAGRGAGRARQRRRARSRRPSRRPPASPPQLDEHARDRRCRARGRRCARRRRAATASARSSPACSSRSRSRPPRCAASTSRLTQAEARRDRLVGGRKGPGRRSTRRGSTPPGSAPPRAEAEHHAAEARLADWQERVPALDEARRSAAGRGQRRGRRHADLRGAARGAEGAAGKGPDRGQAQALARRATASNRCAGLWTRVRIEPGWEAGARGGAARAPRLRSRSAGSTRCAPSPPMRRRPGWRSSPRPRRRSPSAHRTLPRLADLLHLGDAGLTALLGDWLEGVYTARRPRRGARRALQPAPTAK